MSEHIVPTQEMKERLELRVRTYEEQLADNQEALTYWTERGLSKGLAEQLRIGFVNSALPGDGWMRNCLAIPYVQFGGVVTSIKFRAIDDSQPKYRKQEGEINRLYNTNILQTARRIVLVEGEIDTASCLEAGLQAVGIPGVQAWKQEWNRIFRNRDITVLCDGDEPGEKLGSKLTNTLWGSRMVVCPEGQDPNSLLVQYGPEYLRRLVVG